MLDAAHFAPTTSHDIALKARCHSHQHIHINCFRHGEEEKTAVADSYPTSPPRYKKTPHACSAAPRKRTICPRNRRNSRDAYTPRSFSLFTKPHLAPTLHTTIPTRTKGLPRNGQRSSLSRVKPQGYPDAQRRRPRRQLINAQLFRGEQNNTKSGHRARKRLTHRLMHPPLHAPTPTEPARA